jgi:hypothetical protein
MKSFGIDEIPSGAKAQDCIGHFAARLKSCPDASCYSVGIFPQTVKPGPFKTQTDSTIFDLGIIQEKP